MARKLHSLCVVVLATLLAVCFAGGCVIPPPLNNEPDAGANAAPIILEVRDEAGLPFPRPEPKTLFRVDDTSATVTVYDTDRTDTLYVKFYVNYQVTEPSTARAECTAAPPAAGGLQRTALCKLRGLCLAADVDQTVFLEVQVFDRAIVDGREPLFKGMPEGGLTSRESYLLRCQEPPS